MKTFLKFTFFILIILVVLALVGVEPLANYKQQLWDRISSVNISLPNLSSPPIDLVLNKAHIVNDDLYLDLTVSPNDKTELGQAYRISSSDGRQLTQFVLRHADQELSLIVSIPTDISSKIIMATYGDNPVVTATRELESANKHLIETSEKINKMDYDWLIRGIAPSYEIAKKLGQENIEAKQAVTSAEEKLKELKATWSNRTLAISLDSILPYLTISKED